MNNAHIKFPADVKILVIGPVLAGVDANWHSS